VQEQLEANKELVRQFAASVDAGDWAAFDTLVAADIRRHSRATTANPEIRSREEFKQHEQARHTPWPDGHVTYDIMVAEGDFVATYATCTGTHQGTLGVFPPTGRSVEAKFLALFRVDDGQIAEIWVEWDNIATLIQLGLYPPAGTKAGG
jgi:predicted ester cyclase